MDPIIAIPLSAVVFGLSHLWMFTWPMVVCATILGLLNGFMYWMADINGYTAIGFIVCIILHFIVGIGGWHLGVMSTWRK